MARGDGHGAVEVRVVAAPHAADLDVLAVHLEVRVDLDRAVVGVVAADDDAAAVADHVERVRHRLGRARRLDRDIRAVPARHPRGPGRSVPLPSPCRHRAFVPSRHRDCRSPRPMVCVAPILRAYASRSSGAPMTIDLAGARQPRQRRDRLSHRTGAEHDDGLIETNLGAIDRMKCRHQTAAAADERLGSQTLGQPDHLHARLDPDLFGPSAQRPVVGAVGDAVDLARGAPGALPRDEALVAGAAGLVDVEEGDQVALAKGDALDVGDRSTKLFDAAHRDVSGHQRVGHAAQPPVMEVHVGAAHLAVQRAQQRRARLEHGCGQLDDLDRRVWRGDGRRANHAHFGSPGS